MARTVTPSDGPQPPPPPRPRTSPSRGPTSTAGSEKILNLIETIIDGDPDNNLAVQIRSSLKNIKSRKTKLRFCAKCRNHKDPPESLAGHKKHCPFRYCSCPDCKKTNRRRKAMAVQTAQRRERDDDNYRIQNGLPTYVPPIIYPAPLSTSPSSSEADQESVVTSNNPGEARYSGYSKEYEVTWESIIMLQETCKLESDPSPLLYVIMTHITTNIQDIQNIISEAQEKVDKMKSRLNSQGGGSSSSRVSTSSSSSSSSSTTSSSSTGTVSCGAANSGEGEANCQVNGARRERESDTIRLAEDENRLEGSSGETSLSQPAQIQVTATSPTSAEVLDLTYSTATASGGPYHHSHSTTASTIPETHWPYPHTMPAFPYLGFPPPNNRQPPHAIWPPYPAPYNELFNEQLRSPGGGHLITRPVPAVWTCAEPPVIDQLTRVAVPQPHPTDENPFERSTKILKNSMDSPIPPPISSSPNIFKVPDGLRHRRPKGEKDDCQNPIRLEFKHQRLPGHLAPGVSVLRTSGEQSAQDHMAPMVSQLEHSDENSFESPKIRSSLGSPISPPKPISPTHFKMPDGLRRKIPNKVKVISPNPIRLENKETSDFSRVARVLGGESPYGSLAEGRRIRAPSYQYGPF